MTDKPANPPNIIFSSVVNQIYEAQKRSGHQPNEDTAVRAFNSLSNLQVLAFLNNAIEERLKDFTPKQ